MAHANHRGEWRNVICINESSPTCQIGSELNLTLIKLLVLVVSFTGVFRTTCVPEEVEPVEPGELDKPR